MHTRSRSSACASHEARCSEGTFDRFEGAGGTPSPASLRLRLLQGFPRGLRRALRLVAVRSVGFFGDGCEWGSDENGVAPTDVKGGRPSHGGETADPR